MATRSRDPLCTLIEFLSSVMSGARRHSFLQAGGASGRCSLTSQSALYAAKPLISSPWPVADGSDVSGKDEQRSLRSPAEWSRMNRARNWRWKVDRGGTETKASSFNWCFDHGQTSCSCVFGTISSLSKDLRAGLPLEPSPPTWTSS